MTYAIEHGSTRLGRWLRLRRFRITLGLAAVEGLLYLVGVLGWWEAVLFALVAGGLWWFAGRGSRSDVVREVTWILAASQLIVLCVPLALGLVKAVAIAVVALLAVVALFFLFTDRR
ncbi:MAG TPA: hypothetical protein VLV46_13095 [Gaiellaceae bacterium]|nr:hypothetical protein [Gaiellaceae bacterium]